MSNRIIAFRAALLAASVASARRRSRKQPTAAASSSRPSPRSRKPTSTSAATRDAPQPAAKVVPGDEVVWTIVANNVCTTPAGDVAITNPVPEHMRYVGSSAFGPGANIEFSLDGSTFAVPEALASRKPTARAARRAPTSTRRSAGCCRAQWGRASR